MMALSSRLSVRLPVRPQATTGPVGRCEPARSKHLASSSPSRPSYSSHLALRLRQKRSSQQAAIAASLQLPSVPLISPKDQWGNWTALFAAGAFGIWSFSSSSLVNYKSSIHAMRNIYYIPYCYLTLGPIGLWEI